jgi:hypothetical protein
LPPDTKADLVGRAQTGGNLEVRLRYVTFYRGGAISPTQAVAVSPAGADPSPESFGSVSARIESALSVIEELRPGVEGIKLPALKNDLCRKIADARCKLQAKIEAKKGALVNSATKSLDLAVTHALRQAETELENAARRVGWRGVAPTNGGYPHCTRCSYLIRAHRPIARRAQGAAGAMAEASRAGARKSALAAKAPQRRYAENCSCFFCSRHGLQSVILLGSPSLKLLRADLQMLRQSGSDEFELAKARVAEWQHAWAQLGVRRWLRSLPLPWCAELARIDTLLKTIVANLDGAPPPWRRSWLKPI